MNFYTRTNEIRWVVRRVSVPHDTYGSASNNRLQVIDKKILQQKWVSSRTGEPDKWVDVDTEWE